LYYHQGKRTHTGRKEKVVHQTVTLLWGGDQNTTTTEEEEIYGSRFKRPTAGLGRKTTSQAEEAELSSFDPFLKKGPGTWYHPGWKINAKGKTVNERGTYLSMGNKSDVKSYRSSLTERPKGNTRSGATRIGNQEAMGEWREEILTIVGQNR